MQWMYVCEGSWWRLSSVNAEMISFGWLWSVVVVITLSFGLTTGPTAFDVGACFLSPLRWSLVRSLHFAKFNIEYWSWGIPISSLSPLTTTCRSLSSPRPSPPYIPMVAYGLWYLSLASSRLPSAIPRSKPDDEEAALCSKSIRQLYYSRQFSTGLVFFSMFWCLLQKVSEWTDNQRSIEKQHRRIRLLLSISFLSVESLALTFLH